MTNQTYNGYKTYDHWNTALWLNNSESLHNLLCNKVELAVYMVCSRQQAITELLRELPSKTPDDADWQVETIEDLFDDIYQDQLLYS